ncbi:hypothetical protein [Teredinibacter purpureus]|uniref:hypothetical protein n=1 Tax=Teredinibacter purpureus TaxID=2731756 RepID=UPI0005F85887|nr:hypothetical protein [Teredinibacter purpureus]
MDLDKIGVAARQRSPWEALDLGFVMARAWWWQLYLSWFVPSCIVFVVVSVAFPSINWLSYLLVWWLKPLWDRGPLFIASRRLFGENTSAREVFRNLWRLYKTDLFLCLTLRRLSFTRSFDMPLTVLEQLKGKKRSARQLILHRYHSGAASWLTVVGFFVEAFFVLAMFSFLAVMVPEQVDIDYWGLLVDEDEMFLWLNNALTFLAMSIVGPFFSVAGFALYISRRIDLEAWDVEIRFRHLASQYAKKTQVKHSAVAPLVLCMSILFVSALGVQSAPVFANNVQWADEAVLSIDENIQDLEPVVSPEARFSKNAILTVLEGEEFHRIEDVSGWRIISIDDQENEEIPEWMISFIEFILENLDVFAGIADVLKAPLTYLEVVLWSIFVVIVVYVIYRYRQSIRGFVSSVDPRNQLVAPPEVLFGLDVTRESLPEDIPAAVRALWALGDHRAATSLLYRALLTGLIHEYEFIFADSNTEGECVAIVTASGNSVLSDYVATLTACWQALAYGHIVPESSAIESLCVQWNEVFPDDE